MVRAVDLKSGGLVMLVVQILPWTRFFCNVHLFRVPRSWTGSVQMKSSMTFIRGYRCRERERDNLKSREVKRLKECAVDLIGEMNKVILENLIRCRPVLKYMRQAAIWSRSHLCPDCSVCTDVLSCFWPTVYTTVYFHWQNPKSKC